jgi:large subunit ribosomal protein L25
VELAVEATHIPERIEVSVEGLEAGTQIHARDLALPEGAELVTDADTMVVNVTQAITAEALEAELAGDVTAEVPAEDEAAEGETADADAADGDKGDKGDKG